MAAEFQSRVGRIPIRQLSPQQPENLWPAKAFVGEVVPFRATAFKEGHDILGVDLLLTDPEGNQSSHRMRSVAPGTDRWQADVQLESEGDWVWSVKAWVDDYATWLHDAEIKVAAGIDAPLMLAMGSALLGRAVAADPSSKVLQDAATTVATGSLAAEKRLAAAADTRVVSALRTKPLQSLVTLSLPLTL